MTTREILRRELVALQGEDGEEVDLMMEDYDEYDAYMEGIYRQEEARTRNYDDGIIAEDDR